MTKSKAVKNKSRNQYTSEFREQALALAGSRYRRHSANSGLSLEQYEIKNLT